MATRNIQAYRLRTEIAVDGAKGKSELKAVEGATDKVGLRFKQLGKDIDGALKGKDLAAGKKFGENFGNSAVTSISATIGSMGATLGTMIGTAIAPGIGTAIGGTVGSAVDSVLGKVAGSVMELVGRGMELNKLLEDTTVEFKTFAGSEAEAVKYLEELKKLSSDTGLRMGFLVETSEHVFDLTGNLKATNLILKAATDQAADFGGKAETVAKIAEVLGLIHEKGELVGKDMKTLFKLGIDAPKLLAQATGKSEAFVKKMIAQGRIKGDVASRLIAQGIEHEKGGYAAYRAGATTSGLENKASALLEIRSAEGTRNLMRAQKDFLTQEVAALQSETAQKFVGFIDDLSGKLVDLVERGIKTGVRVTSGLAQGILSGESMSTLKGAFSTLSGGAVKLLQGAFGIESPSKLMAKKIGIPMGEGIALGLQIYAEQHAKDDVEKFIQTYAAAAIEAQKKTGVPASVTLAQAILESNLGKSGLTKRANNFFGIKGRGPAGSVTMRTREETRSGQSYYVKAPFRAYNNATESIDDHARFLQGPRYRGALQVADNPKEYAKAIARAGYATDRNYAQTLGGLIDKFNLGRFDVGGAPVSESNPMPVRISTGQGQYLNNLLATSQQTMREMGPANVGPGRSAGYGAMGTPIMQEMTVTLGEADAATVDVIDRTRELIAVDHEREMQLMDMVTLPPAVAAAGLKATEQAAQNGMAAIRSQYEFTADQMEQNARQVFGGIGAMVQDAIGQIAGMMPSQQVGKKRGLFSKILGFAAPFLSFIPGAGPLLSTIAGAASNIAGGNYGAALSGIAGGLQAGGVFRSSGAGSAGSHSSAPEHRAFGGRAYAGRPYIIGEHRPELFVPDRNGQVLPEVPGGSSAGMMAMLGRLHSVMDRFDAFPPDHIVAAGARGLTDAMSRDAGLTRLVGRHLRLP